jgi:hypothetical protein
LSKSDFEKLYNNQTIDIMEYRWIYSLNDNTVYINPQSYVIGGKYDKRRKLFSMGKWVNTSPIIINEEFKEIPLDLAIRKQASLIVYTADTNYSELSKL